MEHRARRALLGALLVGDAVGLRRKRAHVMIEVPGQLGRGEKRKSRTAFSCPVKMAGSTPLDPGP